MSIQVLSIQNSLEYTVSEISISYNNPKIEKWNKVVIKNSSDEEYIRQLAEGILEQ